MNQKKATLITIIVALFFGVFFVYPVVEIVKVGFQDASGAFTREGIWNAFCMGISSTLVTFLIALPLAMASYRWVFPGKKWLSILILAPLVLPPFIGAVGVKHILGVELARSMEVLGCGHDECASPLPYPIYQYPRLAK